MLTIIDNPNIDRKALIFLFFNFNFFSVFHFFGSS